MEPQRNAHRQVNARHRLAAEILGCKNHQIRPASIQIVSKGHDIAFVFPGAERRRSKHSFARRAMLKPVLLDAAVFNVMFEQDIARRVPSHGGRGNDVVLQLLERGRVSVTMPSADPCSGVNQDFLMRSLGSWRSPEQTLVVLSLRRCRKAHHEVNPFQRPNSWN